MRTGPLIAVGSGPDGERAHRGWSALENAACFGILAVAVAFRLHALGRLPGINGDEAWSGVVAAGLGANPTGWLTPSGNPIAPFQVGLLALLSPLAPPSFALLRVPSLLASLAQMLLTFLIARKHFGRGIALGALLLTVALPIEIAYARFGWDSSHTGFVAVAALHFAVTRRLRAVAALFALAVWVHPTNVFLAPFLISALVFAEADWRRAARRVAVVSLIAGAALILVVLVRGAVISSGTRTATFLWRAIDPRQWAQFALSFARLLDGDTIFTYVTGSGLGAARLPVDLAALALISAALAIAGPRLLGQPAKLGIVVGWLATVAAFFLFAGPEALRPGFERYGMCLMVPTILALSILFTEAAARLRAPLLVAAICVVLLVAFWRCYFVALETTGSTSHETFWTGPVEPKAEAFRRIAAAAGPKGAQVVAESWWLYWPLAYLARGTAVRVHDGDHLGEAAPPPGTYFVGFPGGRVEEWARRSGAARRVWVIPGAAGRVNVEVWRSPGE